MKRKLTLSNGLYYELAFMICAVLWGRFFKHPMFADFRLTLNAVIIGVLATIPLLTFFIWASKSKIPVLVHHRTLMDSLMPFVLGGWSVIQLVILSLAAGVAEEALFRDAIQGGLAERIGTPFAIILASALFGASHMLTWTYGILAALIGVYLGVLYVLTGNLLAPMITHFLYDAVFLIWSLKGQRRE